MEIAQAKIVIEAALLSSTHPLSVGELRKLFDHEYSAAQIEAMLAELVQQWQDRGVHLVAVASGWRFQTAPAVAGLLNRLYPEKPARYSRAVLETLAIVAYRQPVTRGDIEDIRGVTVSTQVVRTLEERGWIEVIGHKDVIGRPALFATTRQFLDDLGLRSLDQLPELASGRAPESEAGLIGQQVLALSGPAMHAPAVPEPAVDSSGLPLPDPAPQGPALQGPTPLAADDECSEPVSLDRTETASLKGNHLEF